MSDLVVLVADGTMRAVFSTFFERPRFHEAIGCSQFDFNPVTDIFNDVLHTDGGVHLRAQELLRLYLRTHRYALVVLDGQFGGERPCNEIRDEIQARLDNNGWDGRSAVIVIDPELEVLLWQDNPNVERALGHTGPDRLRRQLATNGDWPLESPKPHQPKELIQRVIRQNGVRTAFVAYTEIARTVTVRRCRDEAFLLLRDSLRAWFPA